MYSLGKQPVKLQLGNKEYMYEFYIYASVQSALISWKACKQLNILLEYYSQPITIPDQPAITKLRIINMYCYQHPTYVSRSHCYLSSISNNITLVH